MYRLRVAGKFGLFNGAGNLVSLSTDKDRALFAYLGAHLGQPVRRDTLATLLWTEWDETGAKRNLRKALFRIKKALNQAEPDLADKLLKIAPKLVVLSAENVTCDLSPFQPENYRGHLLEGINLEKALGFEEWRALFNENLHQQAQLYFFEQASEALTKNQGDSALAYANRQIELEPWREGAHRQAMQAYAILKEWSNVTQQYKSCVAILEEELGVEPSDETESLYRTLTRQGSRVETQNNLPKALGAFFGRKEEQSQLNKILANRTYRLNTITAYGGSGKTRLALEIARHQLLNFSDGVFFIPLETITSHEQILPTIATELGLRINTQTSVAAQVQNYLDNKEVLLVLDNLEHIERATDVIYDLLNATTHVCVLATSRTRLNLRMENLIPLDGLEAIEGAPSAAVDLFFEGAYRQRTTPLPPSHLPVVLKICQMLHGSPLGIELAAAQMNTLTVDAIEATLRKNIDAYAITYRDIPKRQHSMRAIFDYSWALLSPEEKITLTKSTVFQGGFSAEAADAVLKSSQIILQSLVKQSLLRWSGERYTLHPLIREFANAQLSNRDLNQQAHAAYYCRWILSQLAEARWLTNPNQRTILQTEISNVDVAWRMAVQHNLPNLLIPIATHFASWQYLDSQQPRLVQLIQVALDTFQMSERWSEPEAKRCVAYMLHAQASIAQAPEILPEINRVLKKLEPIVACLDDQLLKVFLEYWRAQAVGRFTLNYEAGIDHLHKALAMICKHQLEERYKDWCLLSVLYLQMYINEKFEEAVKLGEKLIRGSQNNQNLLMEFEARRNLVFLFLRHGRLKLIELEMTRLKEIAEETSNSHLNMHWHWDAGHLYKATGHLTQAIAARDWVIEFEQRNNISSVRSKVMMTLKGQVYLMLGQYRHAIELATNSLQFEGKSNLTAVLIAHQVTALSLYYLGDYQQAAAFSDKAFDLGKRKDKDGACVHSLVIRGDAMLALGRHNEALKIYIDGRELWRNSADNKRLLAPELTLLSGLTDHAVATQNYACAATYAHEIAARLQTNEFPILSIDLMRIYWSCYAGLKAAGDSTAEEFLQIAKSEVQRRSALIEDEGQQRSFLTCVPANRKILAEHFQYQET